MRYVLARASARAPTQGREQVGQTVVINLLHELQQAANFALGKAFASKPVQVVGGQIGYEHAPVLAKRHGQGHQALQILWAHGADLSTQHLGTPGLCGKGCQGADPAVLALHCRTRFAARPPALA